MKKTFYKWIIIPKCNDGILGEQPLAELPGYRTTEQVAKLRNYEYPGFYTNEDYMIDPNYLPIVIEVK